VKPYGFLFSTFRGEADPFSEQVYFGLSRDGKNWSACNAGKPCIVSKVGEQGMRDPFVLRSHDSQTFWLIATDLSINRNSNWERAVREGSRSILVSESKDLVNWSEPRLVQVAAEDAGCAWAPEAIYDPVAGDYLVFWASTAKRDDFQKQRIWAAHTKDFRTFGKSFIYIDHPHHTIDTTMVWDGRAFYRFTKDEKFKAITMERADKVAGPWTDVAGFNLGKLVGYEGPFCFALEPGTWCLLLDHYAEGRGYQPFICRDLSTGNYEPVTGFSFPFKFRHGSVLALTESEYRRIESEL
jgi:hypothetical protein